jgi:acyl-CoA thioesterase I
VLALRRAFATTLGMGLLVTMFAEGYVANRAYSDSRCDRFAAASEVRAAQVTGHGDRVVVIGDSWSAGLGLDRPAGSWPARLSGRVQVAGFSGSGFSARASDCGPVSFADRAPAAVSQGASLVVIAGGLNDVDRSKAEIGSGFGRLVRVLKGYDVVVVGPASAPSRARGAARVDRLLASLSRRHEVAYISTSELDLTYLDDGLHLTSAGHRAFGDAVAERIAALR